MTTQFLNTLAKANKQSIEAFKQFSAVKSFEDFSQLVEKAQKENLALFNEINTAVQKDVIDSMTQMKLGKEQIDPVKQYFDFCNKFFTFKQ